VTLTAHACTVGTRRSEVDTVTSRKPQSPAGQPAKDGQAEVAPIHGPGRGGHDRRSTPEYARDLAAETERSLRRDPKRWTPRRTDEFPKHRGSGRGGRAES